MITAVSIATFFVLGVEKAKELLERTREEDNERYKVPLAGVEALKLMKGLAKDGSSHVDGAIQKMNDFQKDHTSCAVM